MTLPILRLKPNADRRLRAGHLWVYSNEINTQVSPLPGFISGEQAILENASGKALGIVVLSPNNLICARIISRDTEHPLGKSLLAHRINIALALRKQIFNKPFYRLVYGDSDLLPGLIVDSFGDILVAQLNSAAMEQHKDEVLAALIQVLKPKGIVWKNDSSARTAEALPSYVEIAYGEVPEWARLEENGVTFEAPIIEGQKTGWFYDHRFNRAHFMPYVKDKKVLDLFSYIGGWGIQAAVHGASSVTCIDSSSFALDGVEHNAELNQVAKKITSIEGDVFAAMKELKTRNERFDVIIADPPAFIKRKKDIKNGLSAYHQLNDLAIRLLNKEGLLVSASCSMHLAEDSLVDIIQAAARHNDRFIQLIERGSQGPDHPVHPSIPETRYIKSLTCRVLPN